MTATFWAPGRVNLIGDHTDYGGGLVLPIAIQLGIELDFEPAERIFLVSGATTTRSPPPRSTRLLRRRSRPGQSARG